VPKTDFRVLVADDSPDDLFVLTRAIHSAAPRFRVVCEVRDGDEVIKYLTGHGIYGDRERFPLPDLLILDWRMPRRDGPDTLRWLRSHPRPEMKVAVLADSSGLASHGEARELGAHFFISKAKGYDTLLSALRNLERECLGGTAGPAARPDAPRLGRYTVLVVDDSTDDRFFLRRSMQENSRLTIVGEVCNGDDAIAYLNGDGVFADREQFPMPDLMLLDLKMPGRDGHDVLEWLRKQTFPCPAVVVLTSSIRPEDLARSLELGADAYHVKTADPAHQTALVRELEHLLDNKTRNAQPARGS
jgi:CheY-like chemotaxis protein